MSYKAQAVSDVLKNNYMPYAMSVIVSRAIPEIDGFKPAHRKLLYTMYRMGLTKGHRAKSADIVGQTMTFNPHGDIPIYETMVRMTRGNGSLLHPWIDSKGNFGRVYSRDMQYAAYRYTEARLDPSCECLFAGLEQDAVDFVDNYSGKEKEPVLLPAAFPTILVNANQGIAVGMASNICSFNLAEVCQATRALIADPEVDLLDYLLAPDFSTGGRLVYNRDQLAKIYETGRGSVELRGSAKIDKKNRLIEIVEIPYTTTVEAIIEDITRQVKRGKFKEILDVRDETDLGGLKIAIDYRRNTDPDLLLQKLMQATPLTSNFACNFNILIDNKPQLMGVKDILSAWLAWRKTCLKRQYSFDLDRLRNRLHLLRGLEKILLDIDKAIAIIRQTEKEADVVPNLMTGFSIDEAQAEAVAEIKLRQLNREYILKRIKAIADLEAEIDRLVQLIASDKLLSADIARQLTDIEKKYGRERLTELVHEQEIVQVEEEDFIEDFNVKYFLTQEGYIKKLALTSLRSAGDLKLKENDLILQEIEGTNKSELLFFTNKAQVYKARGFEIPDQKPSDFGEFAANLLDLDEDEELLAMHVTDETFPGYLILAFADGRMVKIACNNYATKTRRKKLVKAFYGKSQLVGLVWQESENSGQDLVLQNSQQRMILLDSDLIPLKATKSSQGLIVMKQRKGYEVTWLAKASDLVQEGADQSLEDLEYYRVRTLPSGGWFLRDKDLAVRQLTLGELG